MKKALFLDRDGVVNLDTGYAHRPEEITFTDGIFPLCRQAVALGYLPIIVTNQAGIGRGYYTEAQFHALMHWMEERFVAEGAPLAGYFFCPHHPEHGLGDYRTACRCRKPQPGMFLQAKEKFLIDMAASVMIGDRPSDLEAARAAGVTRCFLVETPEELKKISLA